jgi:ABC-type polysaccharide/polyol phosphate transport system ATPase subunit
VNAVEFENVSKSYSIYDRPGDRLKELATLGARTFHRDFQALRDLTFSIRRGEVFCLVGENGSGKSTALQLIAGIMQPTSGRVQVNGRVSALLELGAGFNPEFSGRDNVYLNGALMGLSRREIDQRYGEIESFAEIGDFIDQPVKTYSSGMVVRLAFAVAIHVDPELLLVDEALAVGDTYFRHKCMRKVHELRSRGITIVFVSHSSADIQAIGDRVLWLEHGHMVELGEAGPVLARYLAAMSNRGRSSEERALLPEPAAVEPVTTIPNVDHRHGNGRARIQGIAILNEYAEPVHLMIPDSRLLVRITIQAQQRMDGPAVGFVLRNHLGFDFAETSFALPPLESGELRTIDFLLELPEFYPGAFSFSPWIRERAREREEVCDWIDNAVTVQMAKGDGPVYGYVQLPCRIELDPVREHRVA